MTKEDLHKLVDDLTEQDKPVDPTFGIFQVGGGPDESCITANRSGLILFIGQLLKAAKDAETTIADNSNKHITIDSNAEWIDKQSDVYINFIELVESSRRLQKPVAKKKSLFSKLIPAGCIILAIILVIALFLGLWTLGKWIF